MRWPCTDGLAVRLLAEPELTARAGSSEEETRSLSHPVWPSVGGELRKKTKNGRLEKPAFGEHLSHPSLRSAHSSASTERGEVRMRERVRGKKREGRGEETRLQFI